MISMSGVWLSMEESCQEPEKAPQGTGWWWWVVGLLCGWSFDGLLCMSGPPPDLRLLWVMDLESGGGNVWWESVLFSRRHVMKCFQDRTA